MNDRLTVYRVSLAGKVDWTCDIAVKQVAPAHDFAVTQRHLVFLLPSITCNVDRLVKGASFAESCQWSPELGMRVLVVNKADGQTRTYELPPGCLFHVANAWEDDGTIHVHYMRADDPSSLVAGWTLMAGEYRHSRGAALTHARFDTSTGRSVQEIVFDHDAEFPSLLAADVGRRHDYLLCLERTPARPSNVPGYDQFALMNLRSGSRKSYTYGDDWMVEEHLIIAAEGSSLPRWAVGVALNLRERVTAITVFELGEERVARLAEARLPYPLPLGLHGIFVNAEARV